MFFSLLYDLIIAPIVLLIELLFSGLYRVFSDVGLSIIGLSIIVSIILMPLYKRADSIQEEEHQKQLQMDRWLKHIKRHFKGDERSMMIQTYYRENNYNPLFALRSSFSLLLQVPFFIAAYSYLSNLPLLYGVSFGPIRNLGTPDAILCIYGREINVLPILMTCINCISGYIYTKGHALKERCQVFGLAGVFLVLLYRRPSGLVLYWTLNNVFSLVKNALTRIGEDTRQKLRALPLCLATIGYIWLSYNGKLVTFTSELIAACVLVGVYISFFMHKGRINNDIADYNKTQVFLVGNALNAVLIGIYVPTQLIAASPLEFINKLKPENPALIVLYTAAVSTGLFLLWLSVFYYMSAKPVKGIFAYCIISSSIFSLFNFLLFGRNHGTILSNLTYDVSPYYSGAEIIINSIVGVAVFVIVYLCLRSKKGSSTLCMVTLFASMAILLLSVINIKSIVLKSAEAIKSNDYYKKIDAPIFHFSKEGKNVVVLMLDRAIGAYPEYIFDEQPDLHDKFEGFVWYPNAVSFGGYTNFSTPSLFGGYEYTPYEINLRTDESLASKHNEALLVMPTILSDAGFSTTICDPPYAGYKEVPDLSIYEGLDNVSAYVAKGNCKLKEGQEIVDASIQYLKRNAIWYSFFKTCPVILQPSVYDEGNYFNLPSYYAHNTVFLQAYSVLTSLNELTDFDATGNTALIMTNTTTHEPERLQLPEYKPVNNPNNDDYVGFMEKSINNHRMSVSTDESVKDTQVNHYMVNVASYKAIGEWLDYLRDNDVYDNTRIIIVSDHGRDLKQFDYLWYEKEKLDIEWYNPVLMIKGFNSNAPFHQADSFMTCADVPSLALNELVSNPTNPFSGNPISQNAKDEELLRIPTSDRWRLTDANTFDTTQWAPSALSEWYSIKDNIFDFDNWVPID